MRDARRAADEIGMTFAFVGRITEGVGVHVLQDGSSVYYKEIHCEEDELAGMWAFYPRDRSS
jgi:hypothetical protein